MYCGSQAAHPDLGHIVGGQALQQEFLDPLQYGFYKDTNGQVGSTQKPITPPKAII